MIVITNDDGISVGQKILLNVAKKMDSAIAVVPNRQRSAISRAITLHKPMRIHHEADDLFTVNGTPADCVNMALFSGEFVKPDLILSGINWGNNTCLGPMIGSGTIGACWMAALEGIPSIAFSLDVTNNDWRNPKSWGDQEKIANSVEKIIKELKPKLAQDKFFNVNLPIEHENAEIVYTKKIQRHNYKTIIEKREDPNGDPYYWISGMRMDRKLVPDHELDYLKKNNITVTEISLSMLGDYK